MNLTSKSTTDRNMPRLDSPQRRSALINACIDVMRDRQRHAAARSASPPRTGDTFMVLPEATETSTDTVPEARIRRVVTLVPASGTPEMATL
jgi:hypothetical protein